MKLKILLGVLVFLILVNTATIATFLYVTRARRPVPFEHIARRTMGPRRVGPTMERPGRMGRLGPEARKKLRGLLGEFREETQEFRLRIRSMEERLFSLMQEDSLRTAEIDSLLKEISNARLEISRIATRKLAESRDVLSPEEREIFFHALGRGGAPDRGGPHDRGAQRHGPGRAPADPFFTCPGGW